MIKKIKMSKDMDIPSGIESVDNSLGIIKWGKDNLYGQYLNYLYYTCAVHQGIVNRKVAFILGKGLEETPTNKNTIQLFKNALRGMILSNEVSDMYYLEMRLDYVNKEQIKKIKVIPHERVRVREDGRTYEVKEDWTDRKEEPRVLHTYKNRTKECQSVIYPFKSESLQFLFGGEGKKVSGNYYSEPSYKAGIKSILTDIEAVNYQFSSFKNSFSVGTILNLNMGAVPDPNDKKKIENDINDLATGSDNADSVLVLYNNGKETEATVQQLAGSKVHERYNSMSADVRDNILKSHGVVSPSLFGFQTGGSFNQSEMDVAYILMKDDYFYQRQQQILEAVNFVDEVNGGNGDLEFAEYSIKGGADNKTSVAINEMSPIVANKLLNNLTINEIRRLGLLPPIEGGDEVPSLIEADNSNVFKQLSKNSCCSTHKQFTEHSIDEVLEVFSQYGIEKDSNQFIFSESLDLDNPFKEVFSKNFDSALDVQVLGLIANGDSFDKIYKALNIKPNQLTAIYNRLREGEKISNTGEILKAGKIDLVRSDLKRYEIRYTYEVKAGYGAEIIPTTRDFCRSLIELNRMYTREDITNISLALGMPADQVWNYRGGWYHNPNTGKNERGCRHEWKQNLRFIQ